MSVMPRKAIPVQKGVTEAIQQITTHCQRSRISVLALARLSKVSQPSLARFLSGERKTVTSTARIVLEFIGKNNKRHNWHSHATISPDIEDAIRTTLAGNLQSAELLASLIRALKPVLDAASVRNGGRRDEGAQ